MNTHTYSEIKINTHKLYEVLPKIAGILNYLSPIGDLILRCWVAYAFWVSGLTKIQNWDSTLYTTRP